MILRWGGSCCPSSGELYDFDMKRHVLPINWGDRRFWHEKTRTVHHLGALRVWPAKTRTVHHPRSSMILTWEGTYCPSSAELCDFVLGRHVLSIIWGALWIWHEKARIVHHLESYMILTWDGPYCSSFGELYHFDLRRHVQSIIWGALWFWP